jgi:hypothetical protein
LALTPLRVHSTAESAELVELATKADCRTVLLFLIRDQRGLLQRCKIAGGPQATKVLAFRLFGQGEVADDC